MNAEMIAIIITSIISFVSLIISLKNYLINKPKLKVIVSNKESDTYYGNVCAKDEKIIETKVASAEINIINNSPVNIYIRDIRLKIGKDLHRLVNNENAFWEFVYFFYYDENGEKQWDGAGINYECSGFKMPMTVKSYEISSGICLFHDFPNIKSKSKHCKIVLYTAVGKITKRLKFVPYDKNYTSEEMKDVALYLKNSFHNDNSDY